MDTQRTAQIVAWTLVGAVVGALVSALGVLYCRMAALGPPPPPSPFLGVLLVFIFFGAFGIPPGLLGGFLMGCLVAPIRALYQRMIGATTIGAVVGMGYGLLLGSLVNDPQFKSFVLNFGTTTGAVGGFMMPLAIEAIRAAFQK